MEHHAHEDMSQLAGAALVGALRNGDGTRRILIPEIAIEEAQRVGCQLEVACAMLTMESGGGRNVFGHDKQKCPDHQLPYIKGGPVTESTYRAYRSKRDLCGAQGVGPTQLTYPAFQDRADAQRGCWRPEVNCRVGFGVLAGYLRTGSVRDALSRYNTGRPGESPYATKALPQVDAWRRIITGGTSRRTLRKGDTGADVRELQTCLNKVAL